jgi:Flp pilus assembly CpaF family ATPase
VNDVDWPLVAALRAQASELLSQRLTAGSLDRFGQQELSRAIVLDLIESAMAEDANVGRPSWSSGRQRVMAAAVFDSLFRLGRLQPLIDDDQVENIVITGFDHVMLEYTDGTKRAGPPVADSDEELIDFLSFLASRRVVSSRVVYR